MRRVPLVGTAATRRKAVALALRRPTAAAVLRLSHLPGLHGVSLLQLSGLLLVLPFGRHRARLVRSLIDEPVVLLALPLP